MSQADKHFSCWMCHIQAHASTGQQRRQPAATTAQPTLSTAAALMSGPCVVPGSSPLPSRSAATR